MEEIKVDQQQTCKCNNSKAYIFLKLCKELLFLNIAFRSKKITIGKMISQIDDPYRYGQCEPIIRGDLNFK